MSAAIGTAGDALAAYLQHEHDVIDDRLGWIEPCGSGEDRTVYRIGNVAYKIGRRATANPYDHRTQEEARRRGYRWAPAASSLFTVHDGVWDEDYDVLAMPYLEGDGSEADPALMAEMQSQARAGDGQGRGRDEIDGTNYVIIAGQPVVIDFCTVRLAPGTTPETEDGR